MRLDNNTRGMLSIVGERERPNVATCHGGCGKDIQKPSDHVEGTLCQGYLSLVFGIYLYMRVQYNTATLGL